MEYEIKNLGIRFNFHWIFRDISINISEGSRLAVLGGNGAGKSTFVQLVAGARLPSEGNIQWKNTFGNIENDNVYRYVSIAAPYIELIEEFSFREQINFHFSMKKTINNYSTNNLIEMSGMQKSADKSVRYFSSGMKQRLKLLLAVLSDTPLLILDEPASNLDEESRIWYANLVRKFAGNRTIIVASNHQPDEYSFCDKTFMIAT